MSYKTRLDQFKQLPANKIFRIVTIIEERQTYVCKKGGGNHDWAIYFGPQEWDCNRIAREGEKVTIETTVKNIFPCDDAVMNLYRH